MEAMSPQNQYTSTVSLLEYGYRKVRRTFMSAESTPEELLKTANMWEMRANEHIRAADFCHQQADRFLGRVAVPDDYKPQLVLIEGDKGKRR